jgi:acetyl-CoA decarbonylase/synthase complex subunit delta
MAFKIPKVSYSGSILEVTLGKGPGALKIGGETSYPFCLFEGESPNPPKIAMEVWDIEPEDWPEPAKEPFKDVIKDPAAWAKKCVNEFGAEAIVIQLVSTDPNGLNKGADEASNVVKKVCEAVKVPVIAMGTANKEKDTEVLKKVAEDNDGLNIFLGPVEEANHKQIGASCLAYHQSVIASTPIDVNLAKQLNILLGNLGVKQENIIIDPTTGGLGYGLEYSYSVMERIRMAALTQEDDKLQYPMLSNLGNEIWKCKEAKLAEDEIPTLGDQKKRGVMLEAVAAISYLLAGSDIVVLRHPETVKFVKNFIHLMFSGDMAVDSATIKKKLESINVKPEGDFPKITKADFEPVKEEKKEEKAATPKPKPKPKEEVKPKEKPKLEVVKKEIPKEEVKEEKTKAEEEEKVKAEVEAKRKAEEEAKQKAKDEAKKKAEEEKAKAEAEAKRKAEEEAKMKVEGEKEARREAEDAIILKRQKEKEEREAKKAKEEVAGAAAGEQKKAKVAEVQLSDTEKILAYLRRVHKR